MRRTTIAAVLVAAMVVGGVAAATLFAPARAGAGGLGGTLSAAGASLSSWVDGHFGHGGGSHEAVSDASVAAKAIGISEADLRAALAKGQTIAQVAGAHKVPLAKVVAALVADARSELAAQVKSGRLTQAQADSLQADITRRVTDQVNGSFHGRPGDHGAWPGPSGRSAGLFS